ncbi:MAG TPA: TlyA family RNA methyltransferase [Candidatus Binataceae bacterium]|jgi:23S rRNA (cytidine1920-2'-O)/16S rRNA (cytidine1409-2'-O)-methyltransferase|nr:TlyA family RNA methyltransferase [Candidatus Binataceae bacterium]
MRTRLDSELARRGLADSRERAQRLILAGCVRVDSRPAGKPDLKVDENSHIEVVGVKDQYASRGAYKLAAALDTFAIVVEERLALDVGASSGGFTDLLLRRGARRVIALDVGYGQLALRLRNDPRVVVMERTNIRHVAPRDLEYRPELVVIDVSFISLKLVLPVVIALAGAPCDIVALIKPQFEVGKGKVGRGGVVRDESQRQQMVDEITDFAAGLGLTIRGVLSSPVTGPAGNQEYLAWMVKGPASKE